MLPNEVYPIEQKPHDLVDIELWNLSKSDEYWIWEHYEGIRDMTRAGIPHAYINRDISYPFLFCKVEWGYCGKRRCMVAVIRNIREKDTVYLRMRFESSEVYKCGTLK